ncbi:YciI family protein [Seonamhaeicola marinus]|uniref:GTP cyclohydrolase n=1 Tax=Seonamhaeicola marinus TaxID=1912246 RepID=A0A5D0HIN4_9FLAO|nr:YciI family protein [Seonamhaeicola marinus]TYA70149.1 GTP cyclohydrolase [Seonamhaeicola marinus]
MFIVELTYKVPLSEVDTYLEAHINYLNEQYELGHFIASGRKEPRDGGIILSKLPNKETLLEILNKDPFKVHNLADYKLIEFTPSKVGKGFENLIA